MKFTSLLIILMLILSCNNQDQQETLTQQKNEIQVIYAQQVYYMSAIAEANELEQIQSEIIAILENGNESEELWNEFESNNQRIEKLNNLSEILIGLNPSIGPIGPIPMPPGGCFETTIGLNCVPEQNLSNINAIVLPIDAVEIQNIQILNNENEIVGEGTEIFVGEYDQKTMVLEHRFKYTATMRSVIYVKGIGEIIIKTPVIN